MRIKLHNKHKRTRKYNRSRKYKKGGAAPTYQTSNIFDERYTNAIQNIRTEYPEIFNIIQHIRTNGVRSEDIPQLDNAIRTLRRSIYFLPPNSNQGLNELLNRIEEIREDIYTRSFRDNLVGYGGKYTRKTMRKTKFNRKIKN